VIRVGIWLGLLLWNGQESYATIGKGLVSRDKDSSRTHVGPQKIAWGPQWHITSSGKICVPEL
jgi:hypothetical protein